MKRSFLLVIISILAISVQSQIPEDVLKYSWQPNNGTARISAIGGAMGSLGGDISATLVNPAGLGFFKTSEIVLSPGYSFLKNKINFRGTNTNDKGSNFNLGTSGIVSGWQGFGRWNSKAISISINRTANFSNKISYTGQNDFSSGAEQYAAQASGSGLSLDNILNSTTMSLGTRMSVYSYLIDTATLPGNLNPDIVSMAMFDHLKNGGTFLVNQSHVIETSGGVTELAIGYAANMDDKFYIGGSLGIPVVRFEKKSKFREEDATGIADNYFDFYELSETFTTRGIGGNLKLGIIIKPADLIRLGFAIHSPNFLSLEDKYVARMDVNTENSRSNPGTVSVTSGLFTGDLAPEYKYELNTPWKFIVSGSYVLHEVEDVRKQKGFLTADFEYVTHSTNKFWQATSYARDSEKEYYKGVNAVIKNYYKGAINFRVGGELKFTTFMTRLGFAYYSSPYKEKELKGNKMFISGGLGYRHAGFFADLTYVQGIHKDISFPYRLPDKANTFATTKSNGGTILFTLGFKI